MNSPLRDVTAWQVSGEEPLGASEKVWLRDPDDADVTRRLWLFKPVVIHKNGHAQRGDYSERIADEVAKALGVPTAQTNLATYGSRFGTLSRNVRPSLEWDVYTGNLWLLDRQGGGFRGRTSSDKTSFTEGYSLSAICESLAETGAPPDSDPALTSLSGFDVFAGVMLLDAVISNRDRHEQNWSILRPNTRPDEARLAAAYDNESSLAFNLTDDRRERMLADAAMFDAYRKRATAWRFDWGGEPAPTLIEAARSCLALADGAAVRHWHGRLSQLDEAKIERAVSSAAGMSEVSRTFITKLITTNVEEMRHAIRE